MTRSAVPSTLRSLALAAAMLCVILPLGALAPSFAQSTLRAAAVVNDEVISVLDLVMRSRLVLLAAGLESTPENERNMRRQVLRALIDERLQLQEAERLEIALSDQQLDAALEAIAEQNKLTKRQFDELLVKRQILPETLREQVRGNLTWLSVVSRQLRPTIEVSEEEIDEVIGRIRQSHGTTQLRIAEIFLAVDTPQQEEQVRATAQNMIEQIRAGADFSALARQFSSAATASVGGDLGWIQAEQLPEELRPVAERMTPGQIAGPIRTFGGFYIILLNNQRQVSLGDASVELKQILFNLPAGGGASELEALRLKAEQTAAEIDGCATVDAVAEAVGAPGSGDIGTLKLADLPPATSRAVGPLAVGQASVPVEIPGGLVVLVVCGRDDDGVDRELIRTQLTDQRLDIQARRYLRDLRRAANVDIRI